MRIQTKRRLKIILLISSILLSIQTVIRMVYQFQINNEVKYYKHFFNQNKEGLQDLYNPIEIKQIPNSIIDLLFNKRLKNIDNDLIDWNKFAYVTYATNPDYLCNTIILFKNLLQLNTDAKLVLLLPNSSKDDEAIDFLLNHMKTTLNLNRPDQIVIKIIDNDNELFSRFDQTEWSNSFNKLHIFNLYEYERIIYLDNDSLITSNMDELFFLPDTINFAAPLSYWYLSLKDFKKANQFLKKSDKKLITNLNKIEKIIKKRIDNSQMFYNHLPTLPDSLFLDHSNFAKDILSQQYHLYSPILDFLTPSKKHSKLLFATNLMVVKPNKEIFDQILYNLPYYTNKKNIKKYDMDLINEVIFNLKFTLFNNYKIFKKYNKLFKPSILVLPFDRYNFLTGSIKNINQLKMLGDYNGIIGSNQKSDSDTLNTDFIFKNTKYFHFSDYPIEKPWRFESMNDVVCKIKDKSLNSETKEYLCGMWLTLFNQFIKDRQDACF